MMCKKAKLKFFTILKIRTFLLIIKIHKIRIFKL